MAKKPRIRTPMLHWWRRLRYQYLPYATFFGSVALVLYLWSRQAGQPNAIGEVSALRMDATSPTEGKLVPIPGEQLKLLDDVKQGQVLAMIDEGPLLLELAALQVELLQLEAEIPATIESERMAQIDRESAAELDQDREYQRARIDFDAEKRRLAERLDQLALEEIQQRAQALVYQVTFEVQNAKAVRLDELTKEKMIDLRGSIEAIDAQASRDEARQGLVGAEQAIKAIAGLRVDVKASAEQLAAFEKKVLNSGETPEIVAEARRLAERIEQLRFDEERQRSQVRAFRIYQSIGKANLGRLKAIPPSDAVPSNADGGELDAKDYLDAVQATNHIAAEREELKRQLAELRPVGIIGRSNVETLLEPIYATIEAQCKHIEILCQQFDALSVRAPVSGTVAAIWARPGQTVPAGMPIATIAAHSTDYIVSYLRQDLPIQPVEGMKVEVRLRRRPVATYVAKVERVGPQVELIPERQRVLHEVNTLEWGLPVWISVPADGKLRPGELVDLRFHSTPKP